MAPIAIIDDNADGRCVLGALLEGEGHTVQPFNSGKDFLAVFKPGLFRVILMDIAMPEMTGYDLLEIIRKADASAHVLAVTALAYDTDRKRAHSAGFSDFVTKPFTDLPTLFQLITKHLG